MKKPKLLLHACCAPCLTTVYADLKDDYEITVFWFNPNIYPPEEYEKRLKYLREFCQEFNISLIEDNNFQEESFSWNKLAGSFADEPEGGKRCRVCIKYRLLKTAELAKQNKFDFFATTLSVSPHKSTGMISALGKEISSKLKTEFLDRDFKKNDAYKRSIEYCKELNIYRQKYCGCAYSQR